MAGQGLLGAPDTATPPFDPIPDTPADDDGGRGFDRFAAILLGIAAILTDGLPGPSPLEKLALAFAG